MAYAFSKVRLLGYNHTPIFFENGTRYKIRKNLKIQGTFYEPQNESGVTATWTDAAALLAGAQDYDDIILNNVYFGIGKITNITFDNGDHVVRQDYTFDIECYDAIDLNSSQLGNMEYCPSISVSVAALLDKIEESVSYEIDNDGNQTYTQTATIRFNQMANGSSNTSIGAGASSAKLVPGGGGVTGGLAGAMAQAYDLIDALFGAAVSSFDGLGGVTTNFERLTSIASSLVTKSYNMVDGQLTFTRKVTIPSDDQTSYSASYSYDIEADANNVSSVTEKVSIKGLTSYPYPEAAAQIPTITAGALARCNAVLGDYSQRFGTNTLAPNPIQKSVTGDVFRGVFEVSNTFTNDPRYVNPYENPLPGEAVSFVSSTQIDLNDEGVTEITEQGTITGLGPSRTLTPSNRYKAALDFYNSIKSQIDGRVTATKGTNKPIVMKRSLTLSELDGVVQYSVTASDLSDYSDGDLMSLGFRKSSVEATVSMPVHLTQNFNVVNYKQIIQKQNQATVGTVSMSVKLKGNRKMISADGYLSEAVSLASAFIQTNPKVQAVIGDGVQQYIKTASYTFTPNTNDFVLNINWNFFLGTSDYPQFGVLTLAPAS